ncbi:MAG TPA: gamma-butyrobetaine hydroxylase-like domain-containing protein [Alphaproteobacteria bacterium]|nr:gamma-butyrobetaine hydroxylase-like domain-containing protein [Alphaproteobacteria bacterium]
MSEKSFAEKFVTSEAGSHVRPVEIRYERAARVLHVLWADGTEIDLPAALLRVESPSAEVQGHGGKKPPPPAIKPGIGIKEIEPVGNYAVRLVFDDGHDTGIYSWTYLYELGARNMN